LHTGPGTQPQEQEDADHLTLPWSLGEGAGGKRDPHEQEESGANHEGVCE
jgi:hypothetical protein